MRFKRVPETLIITAQGDVHSLYFDVNESCIRDRLFEVLAVHNKAYLSFKHFLKVELKLGNQLRSGSNSG